MFVRELPTTCFGENLKTGVLRIAEYCMVESVCHLVFFTLCSVSDFVEIWHSPVYFDVIPLFLFVGTLVKVLANVLLIQGAKKANEDYLKLWLYVYGINNSVMMIFMLGTGILMAIMAPPKLNACISAAQCMVLVLYCALFKYLCQVVYAFKQQLARNQDPMVAPIMDEREVTL